jgi:peptidoglycan/xylan/chitin deacetylase (PgdA/CDA1 family)
MTASRSLVITIDSELSNFPGTVGLWGRVGGTEWGLRRIVAVLNEMGLRGTFFLDVYGGTQQAIDEQRRAAEFIAGSGHELQLHTHPSPAFDPRRQRMRDYSLGEQVEILELGAERLRRWTGHRPVVHRAGDWGADHATIEALRSTGFQADFSGSAWSPNCGYSHSIVDGNGWRRVGGLLCAVGTCYRDRLTGRVKRVDVGARSEAETTDIMGWGVEPLMLTLHSFSFLRFDRRRTRFDADEGYVRRLRRFRQRAARLGYRAATAVEAAAAMARVVESDLPWSTLPTSSLWASGTGVLKSAWNRFAQ